MDNYNILLAGIGGQGVLLASEIIVEAAFRQGFDVKKSEVHGMSQRGGGVTSHVRFGQEVFSPLIPVGQADMLLSLFKEEGDKYDFMLSPSGVKLDPQIVGADPQSLGKMLNTHMLGVAASYLQIEKDHWESALSKCVKEQFLNANLKVFEQAWEAAKQATPGT